MALVAVVTIGRSPIIYLDDNDMWVASTGILSYTSWFLSKIFDNREMLPQSVSSPMEQ